MSNKDIKKYKTIEELERDVNSLGDWKDPAQQDAFFVVYEKLSNLGKEFLVDGKKTYFPIDVKFAVDEVCASKFPKDESVESEEFYKKLSLRLALKGSIHTMYSEPELLDKKEYTTFVDSCVKYLENKQK